MIQNITVLATQLETTTVSIFNILIDSHPMNNELALSSKVLIIIYGIQNLGEKAIAI